MTDSKSLPARHDGNIGPLSTAPKSRRLITMLMTVLATLVAAVVLIAVPSAEAEQSVPKANPDGTPPTEDGISSSAFSTSGYSSGGYTVAEDRRLYVPTRRGVLRNDRGSGTLRAKMARKPYHGSVRLRRSGSFTYVPRANYNGSDSFRYRACNSAGCSKPATVYLRISPVNDAPVARANLIGTNEDTRLTIKNPGVIGNDSDIDNGLSSLRTSVVQTTKNGSLTLNSGGGLSYMPRTNFSGSDSFVYKLSDGRASDTATVTISVSAVNDPPVANPDTLSATEDRALSIAAPGVLANDTDADTPKANLTASIVRATANGTLSLNSKGGLYYKPKPNFSGTDTFVYKVSDGKSSDTATASINVRAVQDAPVARDDVYSGGVNNTRTVDSPGVLRNDSDADGDRLTVSDYTQPKNARVSMSPGGALKFDPDKGFRGRTEFRYTVTDGHGNREGATVKLKIGV